MQNKGIVYFLSPLLHLVNALGEIAQALIITLTLGLTLIETEWSNAGKNELEKDPVGWAKILVVVLNLIFIGLPQLQNLIDKLNDYLNKKIAGLKEQLKKG